jgi:DNA mismatch repair protein MSH4
VPDTAFSVSDIPLCSSGKRGSCTSLLLKYIREEFSGVPIEPIARKYWNDRGGSFLYQPIASFRNHTTTGIDLVAQLCVDDEELPATLVTVSQKWAYTPLIRFVLHFLAFRYYALSAVCALLKYAEMSLNTRYASGSLRIHYAPIEGTMLIDSDSSRNLELVANMSHKKSPQSLFGCVYPL